MRTQNNIRKCFLVSFFFLSAGFIQAQTESTTPGNIRMGLKFNPVFNWTKIIEGKMESKGLPMSIGYGVMADFNIAKNPNYWLSTEFNLTQIVSRVKSTQSLYITKDNLSREFTNVELKYKTQLIQVPISLKLRSNEIGNIHYYGSFGFAPGVAYSTRLYTTAAEQYYADGNSHTPNSSSNDGIDFNGDSSGNGTFEDNYLPVRLGLMLGAGIETKISGKTMLNVGLLFNNGIMDQFRDPKVNGRSNYLALHLGVFF
jgi:hypothetical protein